MAPREETTVTTETRTTTCACGSVLSETYPAAINRHAETKKHQVWLALQYSDADALVAVIGANPIDALPEESTPAQRNDESSSEYLARLEVELGASEYTAFVGSDAGQAVLDDAQRSAKKARKESVKIVKRIQGVESKPMRITTDDTGKMIAKLDALAAAVTIAPELPPLRLSDESREVKGVLYRPVLDRKGQPQWQYLDKPYIWRCPVCKARTRHAECDNGHAAVAAPHGARPEDRIVEGIA
jgi:hypothetical protein